MNTYFIIKVETINMGGDCMLDVVHLSDGRVIGINEDSVEVYPSYESLINNQ